MTPSPNRFKCARHLASLTQAELAHRLSITRSRVSRIERGQLEPTRAEIIQLGWIAGLLESWFYTPMARPPNPAGHGSVGEWADH